LLELARAQPARATTGDMEHAPHNAMVDPDEIARFWTVAAS
jgi:hypothetical protein